MNKIPVRIGGFDIEIMICDMYYTIAKRKLDRFVLPEQDSYNFKISIYDEGDELVNNRYNKYMVLPHKADVIHSCTNGGMFGYFDHNSNTGIYYISRKRGTVRRNPLLPLQSSMSLYLPKCSALLFHCSAVIDDMGRGHIFTGKSGAGKTTISKKMRDELGFKIIADDTVVLKYEADKLVAYTTPFWDEVKSAAKFGEIDTINAIYQSENTSIKQYSISESRICLLKNTIYRASKFEAIQHWSYVLDTANKFIKCCRYNSMNFEKNLKFWRLMNGEGLSKKY